MRSDPTSSITLPFSMRWRSIPAGLTFEAPVARRFFATLTAASPCPIAFEPRNASWFGPKADELLRRCGVARVAADPVRIPHADEPGGSRRLVYHRLHGKPRMYYSAYETEFLRGLSGRIQTQRANSREVWCVFDNTALHASWGNALFLQRLLA
jgi:uncharacterized protein YecE (DUF72 family)